jgi:hypothetical protein
MYQARQVNHKKNAWCLVNETGHILMSSTSGKKGKKTIEEIACILNTRDLCKQSRSISIIWSIEDVQSLRDDLSDDQAREVLEYIEDSHNAEIGINWDVIDYTIKHLFDN